MKLPDMQEVWDNGRHLGDWACDVAPGGGGVESSASIQHIIEYKGRWYSVLTTWNNIPFEISLIDRRSFKL